jgi:hypothetical protein
VEKHLAMAEEAEQGKKAKGQLTAAADKLEGEQYDALRGALLDLAGTY